MPLTLAGGCLGCWVPWLVGALVGLLVVLLVGAFGGCLRWVHWWCCWWVWVGALVGAFGGCFRWVLSVGAFGGRGRGPPLSRPAPPGAAVGQGVGGGPQGSLPDLAPLGPIYEKSRFQDVKPTLLPNPQPYKLWVKPGAQEEPPSYRSWVLQLEVADWVSFGRLQPPGLADFARTK